MKRRETRFLSARLVLSVLILAIAILSLASCDIASQILQGTMGGGTISCTHDDLTFIPQAPARCDKMGNYDCYGCNRCGRLFYDAEGKEPANEYSLMIPALGGSHTYANGTCTRCGQCQHLNLADCFCPDCNEPVHKRVLFLHVNSTCTEDGMLMHYGCKNCDVVFNSETGPEVDRSTLILPKMGHSYNTDGTCILCGRFDENEIVCPHNHMTGDCFCLICNKTAHIEINLYKGYPATCTSDGYLDSYSCPNCRRVFLDAEATDEISDRDDILIPKLGGEHNFVNGACEKCGCDEKASTPTPPNPFGDHTRWCQHPNMERYPYEAPTCFSNGNVEHYYCGDCYRYFFDAEGKIKIENHFIETVIPSPGHKIVGYICERCGSLNFTLESSDEFDIDLNRALIEVLNFYGDEYRTPTPSDYELISKVTVEDKEFAVEYSMENESLTLVYDTERDVYVVDIPEEISEDCYYTIVATVRNESGIAYHTIFVRTLEATAN